VEGVRYGVVILGSGASSQHFFASHIPHHTFPDKIRPLHHLLGSDTALKSRGDFRFFLVVGVEGLTVL
jgi:hypothetical protein